MDFKGKTAIVTGGSSGIGKATARLLAREKANVCIIARDQQRLDQALEEIRQEGASPGQEFRSFAVNVADYDQVEAVLAMIQEAGGGVDILINCAGMVHPGYVEELPLSTFREQMDVNFFGTVHTVKAVLPHMMAQRKGYIVNVSSVGGVAGGFGYTAYGASKFAVYGFTEALRVEMKPYGIKVSLVLPADTDTPQLQHEREIQPLEIKYISAAARPQQLNRPTEFIAHWLTRWLLTDDGKPMSADRVAAAILKGIRRGDFLVIPDATLRAVFPLRGFFIPLANWAQDRLTVVARRERGAH